MVQRRLIRAFPEGNTRQLQLLAVHGQVQRLYHIRVPERVQDGAQPDRLKPHGLRVRDRASFQPVVEYLDFSSPRYNKLLEP